MKKLAEELTLADEQRSVRFVLTRTEAQQPMRAGGARNTAVRASSGEYLALLDADDIMHPERLSKQLSATIELQAATPVCELTLVGCQIERIPADSTERYTAWVNGMTQEELWTHQFRECTLLAPCWFMPRALWPAVGGMPSSAQQMHTALPLLGTATPLPFWDTNALQITHSNWASKRARTVGSSDANSEFPTSATPPASAPAAAGSSSSPLAGSAAAAQLQSCSPTAGGKRQRAAEADLGGSARFTPEQLAGATGTVPEDLAFFLKACAIGTKLRRVDEVLVQYRHTQGSATSRTPRKVLQRIRAAAFDQRVCSSPQWRERGFYIWGSGRDGRVLYKSLCRDSRMCVRGFLDVSEQRIQQNYHHTDLRETVRVCHFEDPSLEPLPIVTAVALDRTGGEFEANVARIAAKWKLQAGETLWHFV